MKLINSKSTVTITLISTLILASLIFFIFKRLNTPTTNGRESTLANVSGTKTSQKSVTALGRIEPKNAVIKLTGPSYLYSGRVVPFLNAVQNVEISLSLNKELSQKEIRRKAEIILEEVGLGQQMYRNPNQLSGGQKQRVAIARALVKRGRGALSWGEVVTDLVLRPIENERGRAGLDTHVPLRFTASGASAARTGLFYCSPS